MGDGQNLFDPSFNGRLLDVSEVSYIGSSKITWQELFSGYKRLYALTYSSDVPFLSKLFEMFEHSTVLFGYPKILNNQIRTLLDIPSQFFNAVIKGKCSKKIAQYIEDGKVEMFILKDLKSHAKLFILEGDDNHCVITGSANLSNAAMNNYQFEILNRDFSNKGFIYYKNIFEEISRSSVGITKEDVIKLHGKTTSDITDILINTETTKFIGAKTVQIHENINIPSNEEPVPSAVFNKKEFSKLTLKEKEEIFGRKINTNTGEIRVVISADNIEKQKRLVFEKSKKKDEDNTPIMDIDYENDIITLNNEPINFNPNIQDIHKDIECFISFFDGYKRIYGDIEQTILDYYKFMAWFFASPFIPRLRLIARKKGYDLYYRLPNIGVLYGSSNSGKTAFCEFLLRAMTGNSIISVDPACFTPAQVANLRSRHNALPLYFADVNSGKWGDIENGIVKDDDFGIRDNKDIYSCVVVCMNKETAFKQESKKRCIGIRMDSGFDQEDEYKNSDSFRETIQGIKNNFYSFYLGRMIKEIHKVEDEIIEKKSDIEYNITVLSSRIISELINDVYRKSVFFTKEFTASDIVGYRVTGKKGLDVLKNLININPENFKIIRETNKLVFQPKDSSSKALIYFLHDEIPYRFRTSDSKLFSGAVIFNLNEIEKEEIDLSQIKGYKLSMLDRIKKYINI